MKRFRVDFADDTCEHIIAEKAELREGNLIFWQRGEIVAAYSSTVWNAFYGVGDDAEATALAVYYPHENQEGQT